MGEGFGGFGRLGGGEAPRVDEVFDHKMGSSRRFLAFTIGGGRGEEEKSIEAVVLGKGEGAIRFGATTAAEGGGELGQRHRVFPGRKGQWPTRFHPNPKPFVTGPLK